MEGRIAVAAAQNFGIVGNGRQIVVQVATVCVALDRVMADDMYGHASIGLRTVRETAVWVSCCGGSAGDSTRSAGGSRI